MNNRIAEIKSRLEKATPEPWIAVGKDQNDGHEVVVAGEYTNEPDMWIDVVYSADEVADADFIARAPEDIRFLLGEVERLQEAIRGATTVTNVASTEMKVLREENERLQNEHVEYIEKTAKKLTEQAERYRTALMEIANTIDAVFIARMKGESS
jgi:FtsZ-binding cell division protein ZapB